MAVNVYVCVARGSVMSLAVSGASFVTKSIGMVFLAWLGIAVLQLNFRIYIPLLSFFWFFTHLIEAFVIQHYIQQNVPKHLKEIQI